MKVTFVVPADNFSGGLRVVARYGELLMDRGHEIVMVGPPPGRNQSLLRRGVDASRGVRGRDWKRAISHLTPVSMRKVDGFLTRSRCPLKKLDRIRPVESADVPDADVVIATWWETAHWVAALAPEKGAKAYFMQDYGAPGQELEKIVPTWRLPMTMITIARRLEELVLRHVPTANIQTVENSVDAELFRCPGRQAPTTPRVGFVYREAKVKGFDTVLEAFTFAKKEVPNLQLWTFGSRPRSALRFLPESVRYVERPEDPTLASLYGECTAWLFASRLEGFGLPILEALACGTPIIATKAGAAPEWVERSEGWLVPVADPTKMAQAIVEASGLKQEAWLEKSRRARESIEAYSWQDAADSFEEALQTIIETTPTKRR